MMLPIYTTFISLILLASCLQMSSTNKLKEPKHLSTDEVLRKLSQDEQEASQLVQRAIIAAARKRDKTRLKKIRELYKTINKKQDFLNSRKQHKCKNNIIKCINKNSSVVPQSPPFMKFSQHVNEYQDPRYRNHIVVNEYANEYAKPLRLLPTYQDLTKDVNKMLETASKLKTESAELQENANNLEKEASELNQEVQQPSQFVPDKITMTENAVISPSVLQKAPAYSQKVIATITPDEFLGHEHVTSTAHVNPVGSIATQLVQTTDGTRVELHDAPHFAESNISPAVNIKQPDAQVVAKPPYFHPFHAVPEVETASIVGPSPNQALAKKPPNINMVNTTIHDPESIQPKPDISESKPVAIQTEQLRVQTDPVEGQIGDVGFQSVPAPTKIEQTTTEPSAVQTDPVTSTTEPELVQTQTQSGPVTVQTQTTFTENTQQIRDPTSEVTIQSEPKAEGAVYTGDTVINPMTVTTPHIARPHAVAHHAHQGLISTGNPCKLTAHHFQHPPHHVEGCTNSKPVEASETLPISPVENPLNQIMTADPSKSGVNNPLNEIMTVDPSKSGVNGQGPERGGSNARPELLGSVLKTTKLSPGLPPIVPVETGYPVYHIPPPSEKEAPVADYIKPEPPISGINPYEILTSSSLNASGYTTDAMPAAIPLVHHPVQAVPLVQNFVLHDKAKSMQKHLERDFEAFRKATKIVHTPSKIIPDKHKAAKITSSKNQSNKNNFVTKDKKKHEQKRKWNLKDKNYQKKLRNYQKWRTRLLKEMQIKKIKRRLVRKKKKENTNNDNKHFKTKKQ